MGQKVGDVCSSCQARWESKGKEPKVLVAASGRTDKKGIVVPLCPYCDGGAIKIDKLGNHGS